MKVVLVTGASRGIGRGIAVELAATGWQVAIHYNGNRTAAEETAAACREAGGVDRDSGTDTGHRVFQADISLAADRERLVDEVHEAFGRLDALVNNAGIAPRAREDVVHARESIFDEVLRVNLYGPYFLTQLVARRWLEAGTSETRRIIFVTSVSASMVSDHRGEYCVSKAGLSMAAAVFAARLAPENILVYEVRPGIVATDMTAGVTEKYDRLIADGLVPQRRWGAPRDIGSVARAVLAGDLDFCAGSVISADGGLHIPRL